MFFKINIPQFEKVKMQVIVKNHEQEISQPSCINLTPPYQSRSQKQEKKEQISELIERIQSSTEYINDTFQQTILRHEESFIRIYKTKVFQLTKLFNLLKKTIEEKFINNAITQQLQLMIKERDYFKYECLKLNAQYNNLMEDFKNLNQQTINVNDQMNIYKELLANEKIRAKELEKSAIKYKRYFTQLTAKNQTIKENNFIKTNYQTENNPKFVESLKEKNQKLKKQVKAKQQTIHVLKSKTNQLECLLEKQVEGQKVNKHLRRVFCECVNSWKRQLSYKSRKGTQNKKTTKFQNKKHKLSTPNLRVINLQSPHENKFVSPKTKSSFKHINDDDQEQTLSQIATTDKTQLLQRLFTKRQFLDFLQKLLFDPKFDVEFKQNKYEKNLEENNFIEFKEQIILQKRNKLLDFMKKKKIICSSAHRPIRCQ